MDKNEVYNIIIEDMTEDGLGIGHIDGMAVFVKDTAPGDEAEIKIVKVKKSYAYGRLEKLKKSSECRIEPACPVAAKCGGCTLQHISYEAELELKKKRVLSCLSRIGGLENPEQYLDEVCGMSSDREDVPEMDAAAYLRYRNKMQFPVGRDKEGKTVTGFYAGRTHSIIPVKDCLTGHPVNRYVTSAICEWADKNKVSVYDEKTTKGLLRHILTRVGFRTGELMVCLVINGDKLPHDTELKQQLVSAVQEYNAATVRGNDNGEKQSAPEIVLKSFVININRKATNKILGEKTVTLYGADHIIDYIGDIKFQISAQSFYQVNPLQTYKLYSRALEYAELSGQEKVWDLYCGIGTISLFLSQKAKAVYGVEIVPQAVEDAKRNAEINGITNVEFRVGSAEEVAAELPDSYKADIVVVDPPRKGCDEKLLDTIIHMAPQRMVYVSCNPATLARDIEILRSGGFEVKRFSVFDQFSRGMHVETVMLLER